MILPLCYYDDPVLRKKAQLIERITPEIEQLASDLIETMIHANGVGIAAPQVGKLLRIFIIRDEFLRPDGTCDFGQPEVMINPVLSQPSAQTALMSEGCLSIPGIHADVTRPSAIQIRYQKLSGEWAEEKVSGFRARVIMHENDHLNGVLFIDRLSPDLRSKLEPQLRTIKQKFKKKKP